MWSNNLTCPNAPVLSVVAQNITLVICKTSYLLFSFSELIISKRYKANKIHNYMNFEMEQKI
jgi:hypothetical protein